MITKNKWNRIAKLPVSSVLIDELCPWPAGRQWGSNRYRRKSPVPEKKTIVQRQLIRKTIDASITVSAAVRLIPKPPARVLSRNTNISDLGKHLLFLMDVHSGNLINSSQFQFKQFRAKNQPIFKWLKPIGFNHVEFSGL